MTGTTLHFGVSLEAPSTTGDRATLLVAEALRSTQAMHPFDATGDSFVTWGETPAIDDYAHVTYTTTAPMPVWEALGLRTHLQAALRSGSSQPLRVLDYVIRTDRDDYSERVAVCGIGALEHTGGAWEACDV